MTVGFVLLLVGAFIMVIAARGTYKFLPPFYKTPIPKESATSIADAVSQMPVSGGSNFNLK